VVPARDSRPVEAVAWRTISSASRWASAAPIAYFPDAKQIDERIPGDAKLPADTEAAKLAPVDEETQEAVELFVDREDAERFLEDVRADDEEQARTLRLEGMALDA
jgi:hypothetical protein